MQREVVSSGKYQPPCALLRLRIGLSAALSCGAGVTAVGGERDEHWKRATGGRWLEGR